MNRKNLNRNNLEIDKKSIGQRLKLIRTTLHLSQREFAENLDISASSICSIESGKGLPRHDVIYNLAAKFNVNIYYLLHGSGEMFISDLLKQRIESGEFKPYTGFLKEFLKYIRASSVVKYEMMNYFWKYFIENEGLIEKEINYFKKTGD
ncbi:MAG: helix-turn-helix transcriptional regulator [Candidatus Aminicenantes bacterium]|jgi:transcriptional regulator with XRE-family HTH domain